MYGPKVIPKSEFYSFFQIIMIINNYVCSRIGPEHLAVVVVQNLEVGQTRNTIRQDAIYVEPEELEVYANQPATIIQTVIHLPNTDTRTMSNQLRGMGIDQSTMAVIPVSTNHVILQGFGNQISSLSKMLLLIDDYSKPEDPVHPEIEVLPLEYSSAEEIADTLEELLEGARALLADGHLIVRVNHTAAAAAVLRGRHGVACPACCWGTGRGRSRGFHTDLVDLVALLLRGGWRHSTTFPK